MVKKLPLLSHDDVAPLTVDLVQFASGNFMDMALPTTRHPHQSVFVKEDGQPWRQLFTLPFRATWHRPLFAKGVFRIACLEKPGTVYTSPNGWIWK